jgi:hypothetical protein
MRISKKILAIALSILMAVSMMPFTVFASGETVQQESSVASIKVGDVTTYYDSFEEALAACPENAASTTNITLYKNVTVANTVNITNGKKVKVVGAVGASYTFTSTGVDPMFLIDGGSIEFSDRISTIESTSNDCTVFRVKGAKDATAQYSSLILSNTSLTVKGKEYGILIPQSNHYADGVYVRVRCRIETGLACIYTNGTINQHGANPATILVNNSSARLICTDNKDNSYHDNAAVYAAGYAVWTFSAGSVTGPTALYAKCGTFSCTGTSFTGTGEAVAYSHNGNGITATGEAIVLENCAGYSDELNFSITKGNVASTNADPFGSYAYSTGTDTREAETGFVGVSTNNVGPTCMSKGEAADVSEFYNEDLAAKFASGNAYVENSELGGTDGLIRGEAPGAKVVRGETVLYTDNPVNAANNCQPGETVYALKNFTSTGQIQLSNQDVTIDLQDYTLTYNNSNYPIRVMDDASVTFANGIVSCATGIHMQKDATLVIADDCTVNANIDNYNLTGVQNSTVDIYGTVNGSVTASKTGSVVNVYNGAEINNASGTALNAQSGTTINVYGGEVNGTVTETGTGEVNISGGTFDTDVTAFVNEGATQDTTTGEVTQNYVAKVGGVLYATLEEALATAPAGATVTLLADIDYSTTYTVRNARDSGDEHIVDLKDCTLDMNGHTISTINGTVEFCGDGATIENGTFDLVHKSTAGGYQAGTYALIIDNTGKYPASGTVTVNDVVCNGAVNVRGATVELNEVTASTTPTKFYTVWAEHDANVTVNSGTYTDAQSGGKGIFATGTTTDEKGAAIEVNGGTFNTNNKVVYNAEKDSINIAGGTFNKAVPTEYCADGFVPADNGDGSYGVKVNDKDGMSLTLDDQVKINFYINLDKRLAGFSEEQKQNCYVEISGINAAEESETVNTQKIFYPSLVKATDADDPAYRNCYKVPYLAAPAQITEQVTITVRDTGGHPLDDAITISVADYCREIIGNDGASTELKNLAKAMLDYGKAAAEKFNYAPGTGYFDSYYFAEDSDKEEALTKFNETSNPSITGNTNVFSGFAYVATSLPALRVYLNTTSTQIVNNCLTATISGFAGLPTGQVTPVFDEVLQNPCIDVTGIYGENLDKTITVNFAGATLTITALQYAKMTYDSYHPDSAQSNFARSLYFYNKAAKAYFVH